MAVNGSDQNGLPAVRLLYPNEKHDKLLIDDEGIALLESLKGPVSVLSIVGTQREGKSTLLNLLHSRNMQGGFGMGHYMQPKTTGLWIRVKKAKGFTIVYVDSEGLDSPHVPQFYNWTLSALTLLISDIFVYQSRGSIDTNAINRLHVILQIAEQLLKPSKGAGNSSQSQPNNMLASLLWLLRDHHLNMELTPREEMLEKLTPESVSSIKRCFKEFDCFPLPQPTSDLEALRNLEKFSFEQLGSQFKEEFVVLERKLMDQLRKGRSFGKGSRLTGVDISDLLRKYTSAAFKAGNDMMTKLEQLPTQAEMVARIAAERAVDIALSAYVEHLAASEKSTCANSAGELNNVDILRMPDLCEEHRNSINAAKLAFTQEIIGDFESLDNMKYWNLFLAKVEVYADDLEVAVRPDEQYKPVNEESENFENRAYICPKFSRAERLIGGKFSEYLVKRWNSSYSQYQRLLKNIYKDKTFPIERFEDTESFDCEVEKVWQEYKLLCNQQHKEEPNSSNNFGSLFYIVWKEHDRLVINSHRCSILKNMINKPFIETKEMIENTETRITELSNTSKKQVTLVAKKVMGEISDVKSSFTASLEELKENSQLEHTSLQNQITEKTEKIEQVINDKLCHEVANIKENSDKMLNELNEKRQSDYTSLKQLINENAKSVMESKELFSAELKTFKETSENLFQQMKEKTQKDHDLLENSINEKTEKIANILEEKLDLKMKEMDSKFESLIASVRKQHEAKNETFDRKFEKIADVMNEYNVKYESNVSKIDGKFETLNVVIKGAESKLEEKTGDLLSKIENMENQNASEKKGLDKRFAESLNEITDVRNTVEEKIASLGTKAEKLSSSSKALDGQLRECVLLVESKTDGLNEALKALDVSYDSRVLKLTDDVTEMVGSMNEKVEDEMAKLKEDSSLSIKSLVSMHDDKNQKLEEKLEHQRLQFIDIEKKTAEASSSLESNLVNLRSHLSEKLTSAQENCKADIENFQSDILLKLNTIQQENSKAFFSHTDAEEYRNNTNSQINALLEQMELFETKVSKNVKADLEPKFSQIYEDLDGKLNNLKNETNSNTCEINDKLSSFLETSTNTQELVSTQNEQLRLEVLGQIKKQNTEVMEKFDNVQKDCLGKMEQLDTKLVERFYSLEDAQRNEDSLKKSLEMLMSDLETKMMTQNQSVRESCCDSVAQIKETLQDKLHKLAEIEADLVEKTKLIETLQSNSQSAIDSLHSKIEKQHDAYLKLVEENEEKENKRTGVLHDEVKLQVSQVVDEISVLKNENAKFESMFNKISEDQSGDRISLSKFKGTVEESLNTSLEGLKASFNERLMSCREEIESFRSINEFIKTSVDAINEKHSFDGKQIEELQVQQKELQSSFNESTSKSHKAFSILEEEQKALQSSFKESILNQKDQLERLDKHLKDGNPGEKLDKLENIEKQVLESRADLNTVKEELKRSQASIKTGLTKAIQHSEGKVQELGTDVEEKIQELKVDLDEKMVAYVNGYVKLPTETSIKKYEDVVNGVIGRIEIIEKGLKINIDNLVDLRAQTESIKTMQSQVENEDTSLLLTSVGKLRKESEALWDSLGTVSCRVTDIQAEIDNITGRRRR